MMMVDKTKNIIKFLLIVTGIALFSLMPYLSRDIISGDDMSYHLNRIISINEEISAGEFPVLIHSRLLEGFGYANPLFYPELFLYIPAILLHIGFGTIISYKLFLLLIAFATVLITYFSANKILKNKSISWTVTLLYVLSTYRLGDIYIRGALGEILAFTFLPLVLAGLYEIIFGENKKWWLICLGVVGIVNSHVLTSIMILIVIMVIVIINIKTILTDKKRFKNLFLAGIICVLLSVSFVLPYLEQISDNTFQMVQNVDGESLKSTASSFQDLFNNNISGVGHEFTTGILLIIFPIFILKCKNINYKENPFLMQILILGIVSLIIRTKIFPWERLELLKIIQFPFRISIVTTLFLSFISGYAIYEVFENKKDMVIIMQIIIIVVVGIQLLNINTNPKNANWYYDTIMFYPYGYGEYIPVPFNSNIKEVFNVYQEDIKIDYIKKNSRVEFYYDSDSDFRVHVPIAYYKGYVAYITDSNENKTNLKVEKNEYGHVVISNDENISGNVIVEYKMTIIQAIGYIISTITFIALIIYIMRNLPIYAYDLYKRI